MDKRGKKLASAGGPWRILAFMGVDELLYPKPVAIGNGEVSIRVSLVIRFLRKGGFSLCGRMIYLYGYIILRAAVDTSQEGQAKG